MICLQINNFIREKDNLTERQIAQRHLQFSKEILYVLQNFKHFDDYIKKAIIKGFNLKDDAILSSITHANEIGRLI